MMASLYQRCSSCKSKAELSCRCFEAIGAGVGESCKGSTYRVNRENVRGENRGPDSRAGCDSRGRGPFTIIHRSAPRFHAVRPQASRADTSTNEALIRRKVPRYFSPVWRGGETIALLPVQC